MTAGPSIYSEDADTAHESVGSGWESTSGANGSEPCKRHRWGGGDVCTRCGASRENVAASKAADKNPDGEVSTVGRARTPRGSRSGDLETMISIGWAGIGFAMRRQPFLLQESTGRLDGNGEEITVAKAVGAAWSMEAAVAGKRIDRALRRTPVYKHIVRWITPAGVAADIIPLFVPPIIVGLAAYRPDVAEEMKPMLMMLMVPVMVEAAKLAEQQASLMGNLEDVNQEVIEAASAFVDNLIGRPDGNGSRDS